MNKLNEYNKLDPALLPFHQYMEEMCDLEGQIVDQEAGVKMELTAVETEMPVQLEINVDDNGKITLGASPPIYYVDTTVQPVYHQMKTKVVNEKELL